MNITTNRDVSVEPGQYWRHFKGGIYEIITLATHSETKKQMVVYKCDTCVADSSNYTNGIWVRPLSMFLSSVDEEKYPDVSQRFRFELIVPDDIIMEDEKSDTDKDNEIHESPL